MNKKLMIGITVSMLAGVSQATVQPKFLAGPAEEMELMKNTDVESTAILSKHAMIPINMSHQKDGSLFWQKTIPIESSQAKLLILSPAESGWDLSIQSQVRDETQKSAALSPISRHTQFGMGAQKFPATQYDLENINPGFYEVNLAANKGVSEAGYLLISSDSPYRLKSYLEAPGYLVGQMVKIHASATTDEQHFTVVKNDLSLIESAHISIKSPDGDLREVNLFDDGLVADKAPLDGQFVGQFVATQAGLYQVQVVTRGTTPEGLPFYRTVEHVIPVIDDQVALKTDVAEGRYVDTHKINIDIPVTSKSADGRYRIIAEVWGQDANLASKSSQPITWLSTIAQVNNGELTLQLDDRWLIAKQSSGPYQLQNIRVQDTEHFIDVLSAEQMTLSLPTIDQASKMAFDGTITESMLVGNKPAELAMQKAHTNGSVDAAGGKLMLVHGYCSGDAWGPVQSQFSNNVKFTDFNQNRSHDAFAQRIDSYGDNFPSFGVVAHSQGGAAALHLYTYYWSGLDNAGSGRLIQSVGTPYQGTPLAGNLALIGDIFGVGCGYNSNLTTSGASSWLSGIPTWARSKVNYYTTSFTDKWWRYDYCNFASDLVLSDPEDGTTEKSRGQLSGASNRGHKTGQCHTTGMRDMAQTRDSSRNSSMSANAAR